MYEWLYAEVNVLCVLILLIILFSERGDVDRQAGKIAFRRVVMAVILILLLDFAWAVVDGKPGQTSVCLNYCINVCYMSLTGVVSYLWFVYIQNVLGTSLLRKRLYAALFLLPMLCLCLLSVSSPWTHLIFEIDAEGVYHRGSLYFAQLAISYFYIIVSTAQLLYRLFREKNPQRRIELAMPLSFTLFTAIGGLITAQYYGLPTAWPTTTLSLLLVYISNQRFQISTDGLTGLNNRRQLDKYMLQSATESRRQEHMCLFLMDIDSFKTINDTYGHPEGDEALARAAALLRRACEGRKAFLARYGGDEFAIVLQCESMQEAETLKREITDRFEENNRATSCPYRLTLSIGLAKYDPAAGLSVANWIKNADQALYEVKAARRRD